MTEKICIELLGRSTSHDNSYFLFCSAELKIYLISCQDADNVPDNPKLIGLRDGDFYV